MRNQKGITLVALIITIIVMVILAGVIIASAVADGGIIQRAQGAMKEKERAEIEELIIASYEYKTGASTGNVYAVLDLNATAGNIWDNLTNNGFILKDGSGNEYGNKEGFLDEQEGSDGTIDDKIEVNVEGNHGEYTGTVTNKGLGNLDIVEENPKNEDKEDDDNIIDGLEELEKEKIDDMIRTYFLGEKNGAGERPGRSVGEIYSDYSFLDKSPIMDASSTIKYIETESEERYMTVRYNFDKYKVIFKIVGSDLKFVDLVKLTDDTLVNQKTKLGRYVKYDGKLWIVLYSEGEKTEGAQLISADTFLEKQVCFGYEDSFVDDWTKEDIISKVDIFEDGESPSNIEKAIYSYNNAIKNLNEKSASLITDKTKIAVDEEGIYQIRSVGSNPINPNKEADFVDFDNRTLHGADFKFSDFNKKLRDGDDNYESDYERMEYLGIRYADNASGDRITGRYWLASRRDTEYFDFGVRLYNGGASTTIGMHSSLSVQNNKEGIRPVITLKPGAINNVTGSGTITDPYILK